MKRFLRAAALSVMAVLMITTLSACSGADYAIKVGDSIVSEGDYKRGVATLRQSYLDGSGEEETEELWQTKDDEGKTLSEVLIETLQKQLIQNKLYAEQFDALGLEFTAEEEQAITEAVSQVAESYGSMTEFNTALADGYYTYDEFLTEFNDSAKKTKVLGYYFGAGGEQEVSLQDLKNYYDLNHIYVKFIYISKQDDEGNFYKGEELQTARDLAQTALDAAERESSRDLFPDLIETYSDIKSDEADGLVITDDGSYTKDLTDAAFDLEVGEVAKVEVAGAIMIIKRYEGTTDDRFNSALRQETLEELRAEEIEAMLAEWEQTFKVKINKKITKKYRPEKFMQE